MRLNHFVFKDGDDLVNITTKKALPFGSSEEVLKSNFFLEGQESDSVNHRLFTSPSADFAINVIPTWECNLRCSHCFVLHELVKKDDRKLDIDLLVDFVGRMFEKDPGINRGQIHFVGGEPTLRAEQNTTLIRRIRESSFGDKVFFSATSNGYRCGENELEFLLALDSFVISLDGSKPWHDRQRRPVEKGLDSPFDSTLSTIKTLVVRGARERMTVQSSLPQEAMIIENIVDMYKCLIMAGVRIEKILPGFIAPTKQNPEPDEDFMSIVTKAANVKPCCKYRHMRNFVVDSSSRVFGDYFDADNNNFLGLLSDPLEKISSNHEKLIRASMPVLNDPKCAKCPVIGLCWGWCANTKALRPSDHCKPDILLKRARQNAEKGNLKSFLKNTKKNDISDEGGYLSPCGSDSCPA